jgi:hypothetical protein
LGLNDEQEKLRQAREWLEACEPTSQQYKAAYEHIGGVLTYAGDTELREQAQEIARALGWFDRGGAGRSGDGTWRPTDGRGCPLCGQIGGGGHGGGCPNTGRYDENGNVIT